MNLQRLRIQNFKSLVDLEIINPNPFTVFVGPNAAGKSNIFEALEFLNYKTRLTVDNVLPLFGGKSAICNAVSEREYIKFECDFLDFHSSYAQSFDGHEIPDFWLEIKIPESGKSLKNPPLSQFSANFNQKKKSEDDEIDKYYNHADYRQFYSSFTRLFVSNRKLEKFVSQGDSKVSVSAQNLEKVLKRILKEENTKEEFLEWVQLFIPEFENIEIHTDSISGDDNFLIYEKHSKKPFNKALISDGTYNILALLTAVFQSDEPQFLCIEEPENGLHPKVVKELVDFFRSQCEEKGHYIWLNTHSQTLVSQLRPEEIIVVNKKEGATQIKQFKEEDFHGLDMDEAWLTNALGGGLPW